MESARLAGNVITGDIHGEPLYHIVSVGPIEQQRFDRRRMPPLSWAWASYPIRAYMLVDEGGEAPMPVAIIETGSGNLYGYRMRNVAASDVVKSVQRSLAAAAYSNGDAII